MNEKICVRCKWTCEELHTASVEFKLPVQDGEATGIGQFVVSSEPEGLLSIDIRTNLRGDAVVAGGVYNFHLNQWAADHIERHPDSKTADFRCHG